MLCCDEHEQPAGGLPKEPSKVGYLDDLDAHLSKEISCRGYWAFLVNPSVNREKGKGDQEVEPIA